MSSAMSGHEHDVNGCTFIDDSHIVTSSKDGTCALWDASVGSVTSSRTSTELSSDSHRLARYASPDTVQFTGVAAMSPEDVVAVGFNGTMRHLNIKRSVDDEYRFVVDFVSEGVDEAKANM
jgi:WD40 repeat protein